MSTENLKSTIVTNADATPVDLTSSLISHGRLRRTGCQDRSCWW